MVERRITSDAVVGVAQATGTAMAGLGNAAVVMVAMEYLGIPVWEKLKGWIWTHENPFIPDFLLDDEKKELRKEEREKKSKRDSDFFVESALWFGDLLFGPPKA